jgi:hypothetical protein
MTAVLSRQAEEYLHEGELEKAGAILDQNLRGEEKQLHRTAATILRVRARHVIRSKS